MRVYSGAVGTQVAGWQGRLRHALMLAEASIDFAEEDMPSDLSDGISAAVRSLRADLGEALAGMQAAERVREGFEVAIVGPPNSGKSSLINYLSGRQTSIVTDVPGTTRDVIELRYDLNGIPVTFLDTAGLRESSDPVERIGISHGLERARAADLVIDLAGDAPLEREPSRVLYRQAKSDLTAGGDFSSVTGEGIPALLEDVEILLRARVSTASVFSRERYRDGLRRAVEDLDRIAAMETSDTPELTVFHLRAAMRALKTLVGEVDVEALLGDIFSSFCIGK